eukprot:XP_025982662.1 F-box/FBD/LRR-repeat protein At5g56420 [Glycine max]
MADRISNLPDVVLSHILSLVPTNVAVATSVLSKRWKLLWRSVSTLNFNHSHHDDNNHETCSLFAQRVHAFILMHDMDQPFTRFCLSSSCPLDPIHVNAWISAATQHRVEHLDLSLGCAVELPSFLLFSCKTLVVLKLLNVVLSFNNSCCVYLPRLKILHLSSVAFSKDRDLAQLLSGSPNLEDLEASDLMFKSYVVETEFRRLSNLLRAHIFTPEFPLEVVDNVQFLRINWKDHNGFTSEFQNLTHLEFFSYRGGFFVLDLIKRCPKLQILTIYKVDSALFAEGDYPQSVPICISFHLKICTLKRYNGSKDEFRFGDKIKVKRTKTEKYWDLELANETKPIWGEVEFSSILYVLGMGPLNNEEVTKNIHVYVRCVYSFR